MFRTTLGSSAPSGETIRTRASGSVVADRVGAVTAYALRDLQERVGFFVGPGAEVYQGMIVGVNPRAEALDVIVGREKKLTNMRASAADATVTLTPPRVLSLEQALNIIAVPSSKALNKASLR